MVNKLTHDTYELCLKEQVQNNVFYETWIFCMVVRARGGLSWWFSRLGLLWALEAGMEK